MELPDVCNFTFNWPTEKENNANKTAIFIADESMFTVAMVKVIC